MPRSLRKADSDDESECSMDVPYAMKFSSDEAPGSDDSSSDAGFESPGHDHREPLRTGDVIRYTSPVFTAGSKAGQREAHILAIDPSHESFPLVLDNCEMLPWDTFVRRIGEFRKGKVHPHKGRNKVLRTFLLKASGNRDAVLAAQLQKRAGTFRTAMRGIESRAMEIYRGDFVASASVGTSMKRARSDKTPTEESGSKSRIQAGIFPVAMESRKRSSKRFQANDAKATNTTGRLSSPTRRDSLTRSKTSPKRRKSTLVLSSSSDEDIQPSRIVHSSRCHRAFKPGDSTKTKSRAHKSRMVELLSTSSGSSSEMIVPSDSSFSVPELPRQLTKPLVSASILNPKSQKLPVTVGTTIKPPTPPLQDEDSSSCDEVLFQKQRQRNHSMRRGSKTTDIPLPKQRQVSDDIEGRKEENITSLHSGTESGTARILESSDESDLEEVDFPSESAALAKTGKGGKTRNPALERPFEEEDDFLCSQNIPFYTSYKAPHERVLAKTKGAKSSPLVSGLAFSKQNNSSQKPSSSFSRALCDPSAHFRSTFSESPSNLHRSLKNKAVKETTVAQRNMYQPLNSLPPNEDEIDLLSIHMKSGVNQGKSHSSSSMPSQAISTAQLSRCASRVRRQDRSIQYHSSSDDDEFMLNSRVDVMKQRAEATERAKVDSAKNLDQKIGHGYAQIRRAQPNPHSDSDEEIERAVISTNNQCSKWKAADWVARQRSTCEKISSMTVDPSAVKKDEPSKESTKIAEARVLKHKTTSLPSKTFNNVIERYESLFESESSGDNPMMSESKRSSMGKDSNVSLDTKRHRNAATNNKKCDTDSDHSAEHLPKKAFSTTKAMDDGSPENRSRKDSRRSIEKKRLSRVSCRRNFTRDTFGQKLASGPAQGSGAAKKASMMPPSPASTETPCRFPTLLSGNRSNNKRKRDLFSDSSTDTELAVFRKKIANKGHIPSSWSTDCEVDSPPTSPLLRRSFISSKGPSVSTNQDQRQENRKEDQVFDFVDEETPTRKKSHKVMIKETRRRRGRATQTE